MEPMETAAGAALVRARIYELLACGFVPPDGGHAAHLRGPYLAQWAEVAAALDDAVGLTEPLRELGERLRATAPEALRDLYDHLFEPQGRMAAPPYEGEYTRPTPQHDLLLSAQLADIAGFYRAFGLEPSEAHPDRPDHVATELEFMHVLARKEAEAAACGEDEHWAVTREAEVKFLRDHLGRWTEAFRERVEDRGADSAYAALARLTARWVAFDAALLQAIPAGSG
ncbi:TorD/DmsD family molecular chaperone [Inmirania thermothiophila]|uniref:DMSO reductase family type II enzyme chaperone n=1 Tax=Inmirania thermothiophila TaxID=1750597 RepID=A0A3N1Y561_9GAMM|nr:molecular chaperone TorD family protein [Inmirania thermothiophila]ROR32417.1 DMSO reductase family type II enzyme chaperone [Inmirania thermothiophila]